MNQNQNLTLQEAIDLLPDAVILVSKDSTIVAANLQVSTVFGYHPRELLGKKLNILIPERFRKKHTQHIRHYFEQPTKRRMGIGLKLSGLKKSNEEFDVDIALAPIKSGRQLRVMAIIRDISDLKEMERDLIKKNEELSISNTQLERIGYIIAHDLKSPLLNLQALIHLLNRECSHEKSKKIVQYMKAQNDILTSMMALITGVAEYSKAGIKDFNEELIDLNLVLEEVRKLVYFPTKFSFTIPENMPSIYGNKTKILQVFLNLINNSIKYNNKKVGKIEVKAYANNKICLISISDNGPGVPLKLRNQIFELFKKGNIEKEGSQGIGLAVVKKIIEDHGGGILVETSSLGGADFIFSWPANKSIKKKGISISSLNL